MLIPRAVGAIAKIAAKENTRYAFNGAVIERRNGSPRAWCCDGRRLIVAEWDELPPADYPSLGEVSPIPLAADYRGIVPAGEFEKACKSVLKRSPKAILENLALDESPAPADGMHVIRMASTDLQRTSRTDAVAMDHVVPPIDEVIPQLDPYIPPRTNDKGEKCDVMPAPTFTHVRIGVNAKLLRELLASMEALDNRETPTVELFIPVAGNRPITLRSYGSEIRATVILMPINIGEYEPAAAAPAVEPASDPAAEPEPAPEPAPDVTAADEPADEPAPLALAA
jgi:hypothetical protein